VVDQNAATQVKGTPTISVIIPTFNGAERIPNALSALTLQEHSDFQVIVVIDGSTDHTLPAVESFKNKLNICILEQNNRGRAGARNAGAGRSTAQLLVFLDDDMRPEPNWLSEHIRHHIQHPETAMVGIQQSDPKLAQTDFHMFLAVRSGQWMANCPEAGTAMTSNNWFFTSANCSLPRSIFHQVNGFDEALRDTEDFDLGNRLLKSEIPVFFNPHCVAWHDDFPDLKKYIQRQRQYRNAWFKLIELKPEILENNLRFSPKTPAGLKGIFFKLFAHPCWIRVEDVRIFKMFLPQKLRFKVYDYIVASLGRFNMHIKIE